MRRIWRGHFTDGEKSFTAIEANLFNKAGMYKFLGEPANLPKNLTVKLQKKIFYKSLKKNIERSQMAA